MLLAVLAATLTVFHPAPLSEPYRAHHGAPMIATAATPAAPRCATSAPSTAAGYTAMFAGLDQREFGAADVGLSVVLSGGRSVWLFGDTFSTGRFVHSSAIVQDGGCLHVSNGGAQLLPNDDARHIYWVFAAEAVGGDAALVWGRSVTLTGKGPWDFEDGGAYRGYLVQFDATGDATILHKGPKVKSPAPDPGPMVMLGDHHFGYSIKAHPEARLASGKVLTSMAQNWDDGVLHPTEDYRLIFSEKAR